MNPQKGSSRFPFCQCVALQEPCSSSTVSCFPNEVVIHRRVRRREPALNVASQLVTYKTLSSQQRRKVKTTTNVSSYSYRLIPGEGRLRTQVSTDDVCSARVTYPNPVEYYPLTPCHLTEQIFRKTIHERSRIPHLPELPSYYPQDHGRHPRSVQPSSEPRPGSIGPISGEWPLSRSPPTIFL